jgi:acyl-CoA synthetase (NDP forming)
MSEELDALFRPRTVAIVGASAQPQKWGHIVMKNVLEAGFRGQVFPVNPRGGEVLGRPAYASVRDIPEQVDLAFVGVAAKNIPGVVEDCAAAGCRVAVIVTSGFGETGPEGREEQERLVESARAAGLRLVGPNCMGVYTAAASLYASIGLDPLRPGRVALISQSGNVGVALFRLGIEMGFGFHSFIGVGNQADVGFHEYVDYLADDPDCDVVALYLEGLQNPPAFFEAVRRATPKKPVLVLKGGQTAKGLNVTRTHTGSLATDARIFRGLLRQSGGILVSSLDELVVYSHILSSVPRRPSRRVAILTDGGGFGVLATDASQDLGLELAALAPETEERLRSHLPPYCSTENPVDIGGDADSDPSLFATCLEICLEDPAVEGMLVTGIFGGYRTVFAEELSGQEQDAGKRIPTIVRRAGKPTVVQSLWARSSAPALATIREAGVPVVESLDLAVRGLAALNDYVDAARRTERLSGHWSAGASEYRRVAVSGRALNEAEAYEALSAYGVQVPAFEVARSPQEAVSAARRIGYPVVVKLLSPEVAHKTELGGVVLGIHGDDAVVRAYRHVAPDSEGVLVSQQVPGGLELIVGVVRDPHFGQVLMVGLGGLYVEALADADFRGIPLAEDDAIDMLRQNPRLWRALGTARQGRPLDRDAFVQLLMSVGRFARDHPGLEELDLNPVVLSESGARAVDAKIRFGA